jgi:hypothetical protein
MVFYELYCCTLNKEFSLSKHTMAIFKKEHLNNVSTNKINMVFDKSLIHYKYYKILSYLIEWCNPF